MLKVDGLFISQTKDYFALRDVNLIVEKGKTALICGSIDSGKTTLIRAIIGNEKPAKGDIYINNINVKDINFEKDVALGYLPINQIFFENRTVKYNLEYVLKIRKLNQTSIDAIVNDTLYEFDFPILQNVKLKELSYFEKVKVSLARISQRMVNFLIIDDVFSKLTEKETKDIADIINKIIKKNQSAGLIFISDEKLLKYFKYNDSYTLNYGTLTKN